MTVVTTTSTNAGLTAHTGTIQEVLDALATAGHFNMRVQQWSYDDTNAKYTAVVADRS